MEIMAELEAEVHLYTSHRSEEHKLAINLIETRLVKLQWTIAVNIESQVYMNVY